MCISHFIPPLHGSRRAKLALGVAGRRPVGWGLLPRTSKSPHPAHRSLRSRSAFPKSELRSLDPTRGRDRKRERRSSRPHKGEDRKESRLLHFIPPLYGEGGAKRRVGLLPRTPMQPPPCTSFAALTICLPSPQGGGIRKRELRTLRPRICGRPRRLLHFIPPLHGEGGAKRRVGLLPHTSKQPPILHIVRCAHDLLSLPTRGKDKGREPLASLHPSPLWARRAKLALGVAGRRPVGWGLLPRTSKQPPPCTSFAALHDVPSLPTRGRDKGRESFARCVLAFVVVLAACSTSSLPFMGRVAGRRPVGWGRHLAHRCSPPPCTSLAPLHDVLSLPTRGRDKKDRAPHVASSHLWSSSPLAPLHPSPSWGGWLAEGQSGGVVTSHTDAAPHPAHRSLRSRSAFPSPQGGGIRKRAACSTSSLPLVGRVAGRRPVGWGLPVQRSQHALHDPAEIAIDIGIPERRTLKPCERRNASRARSVCSPAANP